MFIFYSQCLHFLGYIQRTRIAESYSTPIFSVLRNFHTLFSTVTVPIYILTNSVLEFPFLLMLFYICYLQTFVESHLDRCKVTDTSLQFFICISFMISDVKHLFRYLLTIHLQILFGKNIYSCLLPIFFGKVVYFFVRLYFVK